MKRTPLVVTGTMLGLAGVLGFHSVPAKINLGTMNAASTAGGTTTSNPSSAASPGTGGASSTTTTPAANASSASSTTTSGSGTRSATGPQVNYYFGVLSVKVTAQGNTITKVTIGTLNDGGNPRSQYIDQQSIPLLEQQAIQLHNANIQGVSGASYTSAGFKMSLQGALSQLGIK